MNRFRHLVVCIIVWIATCCSGAKASPVRLIFDTDMLTDCDDAGAMAVLHTLADRGECEILATVTSVRDVNAIATVDAINRYRGRPDLPLGMAKNSVVNAKSKFVAQIAKEFPHRVTSADLIPEAVNVYREVLEKQPDRSVVIVTVGYLTNLNALLNSPGGSKLVQRKVTRWICMGGNFIGSPPKDDLRLGNVNFQRDSASAHHVIHHWPGEIVFAGREVCSVPSGLQIGESLASTPADNPVRRSYEHYFGGSAKNRHVADLATVLYAVRGLSDCWDISPPGRMDLKEDMTFEWRAEPIGKQRHLLKKPDNDRRVEAVLEELLLAAPGNSSSGDGRKLAGTIGHVGVLKNPKRVNRLEIDKPGVYENYLIDAQGRGGNIVKITANDVTLRNCEIFNGSGNGVGVFGTRVLIENCRIHHLLTGTFEEQHDAHGITGRWGDVTIRNCDISQTTGDSIQFDPNRKSNGSLIIEHCRLWAGPLTVESPGFKAGQSPGENAFDSKTPPDGERCRLIIRQCYTHGWSQPSQIQNRAALNLKERIDAEISDCVFDDCEIAIRARGPGSRGGARVTVRDCAVFNTDLVVRAEDKIELLEVTGMAFGPGVGMRIEFHNGKGVPGYSSRGERDAPPISEVLVKP